MRRLLGGLGAVVLPMVALGVWFTALFAQDGTERLYDLQIVIVVMAGLALAVATAFSALYANGDTDGWPVADVLGVGIVLIALVVVGQQTLLGLRQPDDPAPPQRLRSTQTARPKSRAAIAT